jgi:nucleoside-diphosphate-sugar epimerase
MIKILITGGAGFVASSLAEKLAENYNYNVTIVDNLLTGSIKKIPERCNFIKCNVNDYNDISQIMLTNKFDYVFHYAAVVGVKRTQENPISVFEDIKGFENILMLSKNTGVKHIYFSSSSEVYGESEQYPQSVNTTPLNARFPYAIVKSLGESFLKSYKFEHGLDFTIFRFFNTYGPKQSQDFVMSKFINLALNNKDITIYGDGSQTRTFCYIDDNIDTCIKIFEKKLLTNETINIGGNVETPILELAETIIKLTNSKSKIVFLPPLKGGDMNRRQPNNKPMFEILNRDLTTLEVGIKETLKKYGNY